MMKFLTLMAATLLVTPPEATASSVLVELDTDRNLVVNGDELHDLVRRMILPFDDDKDGALDPSDLHRMVFHMWDEDDDLFLDEAEFTRVHDWDTELRLLDFSRLDGDGDSLLGEPEFVAFQDLGMYDQWDRDDDQDIDQFEVTAGLIAIFDANGNSVLELGELQDVPLVWAVSAGNLSNVTAA